tara:strand:- start:1337 stop:1663 length:327 start_codon:yes stop_codon:yes gene_type:complete
MSDDGPPRDTDFETESNESDEDIAEVRRRYPETPIHNGTTPKALPIAEICMVTTLLAVIVAHLWTVYSMRADLSILTVNQQETQQQISHIAKLVETMHQVRWRIVSEA